MVCRHVLRRRDLLYRYDHYLINPQLLPSPDLLTKHNVANLERACGSPQFERTDGCGRTAWKALKFALLIRLVEKCWGCCRPGRRAEESNQRYGLPITAPPCRYYMPGSYVSPPWGDSLGYAGRDIPLGDMRRETRESSGDNRRPSSSSRAWSGSTLAPHSPVPERPAAARVQGADWETPTLRGV
jgi:hypothetical protein